MNHVVYMDNYFTSGPLVEELAQDKIYVAGTIKQRAVGFPEGLKSVKLSKGNYENVTSIINKNATKWYTP